MPRVARFALVLLLARAVPAAAFQAPRTTLPSPRNTTGLSVALEGFDARIRPFRTLRTVAAAPGRALAAYNSVAERRPVRTNVLTGAAVMGVGDFLCQQAVLGCAVCAGQDWRRTAHAALVGAVWQGLCIRRIFAAADGLGDRIQARLGDPPRWVDVLVRTFLMQCVLSTGGNYFNMSARKILAGGYADLGATFAGINACFFDVFRTDWTIWPLYLGVAFAVIPPHVRPATTALVNACWGIYISYMTAHAG